MKGLFSSRFMEVSVHNQLGPRQGDSWQRGNSSLTEDSKSNKSNREEQERTLSLILYAGSCPAVRAALRPRIPALDNGSGTDSRFSGLHDCMQFWGDIQTKTTTGPVLCICPRGSVFSTEVETPHWFLGPHVMVTLGWGVRPPGSLPAVSRVPGPSCTLARTTFRKPTGSSRRS